MDDDALQQPTGGISGQRAAVGAAAFEEGCATEERQAPLLHPSRTGPLFFKNVETSASKKERLILDDRLMDMAQPVVVKVACGNTMPLDATICGRSGPQDVQSALLKFQAIALVPPDGDPAGGLGFSSVAQLAGFGSVWSERVTRRQLEKGGKWFENITIKDLLMGLQPSAQQLRERKFLNQLRQLARQKFVWLAHLAGMSPCGTGGSAGSTLDAEAWLQKLQQSAPGLVPAIDLALGSGLFSGGLALFASFPDMRRQAAAGGVAPAVQGGLNKGAAKAVLRRMGGGDEAVGQAILDGLRAFEAACELHQFQPDRKAGLGKLLHSAAGSPQAEQAGKAWAAVMDERQPGFLSAVSAAQEAGATVPQIAKAWADWTLAKGLVKRRPRPII